MKNLKRSILIAIATAAVSMTASGGLAQERPARTAGTAEELNFNGGTIRDYIRAVRGVFPDANIIVSDDAATFHVPAVQLRNVHLGETVQLLEQVARDAEEPEAPGLPPRRLSTGLVGASVWTVRAIAPPRTVQPSPQPRRPPQPDPGPQTTVFSLADVLMEFSEADVLTSVETALGLGDDDDAPAELRLHEATGLLIVRGSYAQLNVVQTVVTQLRRAFEDRRRWKQAEAEIENAEEVAKLRALARDLERSLLHEEERREEMRVMIDRQRVQIAELEAMLRAASPTRQRQPE